MGEQPPWDPYGQHEPDQWQAQPPYRPQQPYGQQQPYPGQPPYQGTPYGQPGQQGQPPGQRTPPASGHRRRAPRKSWPRRHKVLTALGALAALIIAVGIASAAVGKNQAAPSPAAAGTSSAPSATSSPKTAHSAAPSAASSYKRTAVQTAADACEKRGFASGDIYLRMIQPGEAPAAQQLGGEWVWDHITNKCLTSVQFMIATAPQTPGTCTQVGYVADNPGYNVNAASAPPLENVVAQTGPAC